MAKFELKLPKMGESVAEATLTAWLKDIGDKIDADEPVLEIATDKVDSEVPSEVEGVLVQKLFEVDAIVEVGQTIAIIETDADTAVVTTFTPEVVQVSEPNEVEQLEVSITNIQEDVNVVDSNDNRFYSPLVRNIAKKEGVTQAQLDSIQGSGKDGRVTKKDILAYISHRSVDSTEKSQDQEPLFETRSQTVSIVNSLTSSGEDEIIEMSRMGKLVSKHMTDSLQTSAHVQSFIEVDVTKIWNWRKKIKESFMAREGENITFTPIFMEAIAYALSVHPMLNISIQDVK
jgi:2-oxoglutarate dehydrogenase E2 component (dihydrolipoamide succinyltransferase)